MNAMQLHNTEYIALLWILPAILLVVWHANKKKDAALQRFAEVGLLESLIRSLDRRRRRLKLCLLLLGIAFLVFALARPAWNPVPKKVSRYGRDIVFLLDVSRSMLAEDIAPNRLERAKLAILDALETLEGDRVALVVFAGTAVVRCPLTLDYGFFRMMLEDVSTTSVARGGSLIGDALRTVLRDVFDEQEKAYRDIILITDGEDHESFPIEAAAKLGQHGIRLIAIGIGNEDEGERIPIANQSGRRTFLKHAEQEVWSRLDAATLRKMVYETPGGRYLNVATGSIDLGEVYQSLIAQAEKRRIEESTAILYEEKYQVFLGLALLLLISELLIGERREALQ